MTRLPSAPPAVVTTAFPDGDHASDDCAADDGNEDMPPNKPIPTTAPPTNAVPLMATPTTAVPYDGAADDRVPDGGNPDDDVPDNGHRR